MEIFTTKFSTAAYLVSIPTPTHPPGHRHLQSMLLLYCKKSNYSYYLSHSYSKSFKF